MPQRYRSALREWSRQWAQSAAYDPARWSEDRKRRFAWSFRDTRMGAAYRRVLELAWWIERYGDAGIRR